MFILTILGPLDNWGLKTIKSSNIYPFQLSREASSEHFLLFDPSLLSRQQRVSSSPPKPQAKSEASDSHRVKKMEAPRSVGRKIQRKPLADCTNTVSRSSQQSSSSSATLVKFANPSLTSSLKRLVDQTTLKEKTKYVDNSEDVAGSASRSVATDARPVTRRVSADLGFPASSPSRLRKSEDVNNSKPVAGSASRSVTRSVRPVTRRMSTDLVFPATVPSRPQNSRSDQGILLTCNGFCQFLVIDYRFLSSSLGISVELKMCSTLGFFFVGFGGF